MYDNIPKISILVITYNQEKVIGRAIDSVLCQKEYVHEIIIGEDCSTDNTRNIVKEYAEKFPKLIKPIYNEQNLGIFGNMENLYDKPTGDVVFLLAGDDEFCNGLFISAIRLIEDKKINYRNESFCFYFDFKEINNNGHETVFSNEMINNNFNPVSLKLRGLINNRSCGFSSKILNKFSPVPKDIGIYADLILDIQLQKYSTHNYYFPFIGSIYYTDIGIAKNTSKQEHYKSLIKACDEIERIIPLNKRDKNYNKFRKEFSDFNITPSLRQFFKVAYYYFNSIQYRYGIRGLKINKTFSIMRRLFLF